MATLTVWKFDNWHEADQAVSTLESLAKQELIKVHDAATVSWQPEAKKPKTRQLRSLTGAGAMGGMFWGMLFGLIFLVPLLGAERVDERRGRGGHGRGRSLGGHDHAHRGQREDGQGDEGT